MIKVGIAKLQDSRNAGLELSVAPVRIRLQSMPFLTCVIACCLCQCLVCNSRARGHYAYCGVAGNLRCLVKVYRAVERYWRRTLRSRSWAGRRLTWEKYHQIKARMPLLSPKLRLPYAELQALAVL